MAPLDPKDVRAEFVALLAAITDPEKRNALLRQVQFDALNAAPREAFEIPIRTAREYLASQIEVPPIIVGNDKYPVLVRGGMNGRIGRAGKGKTVGALNQLIRWSAGLPWLPTWLDPDGAAFYAPEHGPLRCLIIENEGAGGLFHKQLGQMFYAGEPYLSDAEREVALDNFHVWGDGGYAGLKLDDPEKLKWVRDGVEKYQPDVVFVEPFRGLWNGEENSSTDMAVVVDALIEIAADFQAAVLLSHHERKSGAGEDGELMSAGRGSTVLEGAVTVMENFVSVKGGDYRELTQSKNRHGKTPPPVRLEWDSDAWWYKHIPEDDVADGIILALQDSDEPLSVAELSEITGETQTKVRNQANKMKEAGKLKSLASTSNGRGSTGVRYRLPYDDSGGIPV